MNRARLEPLFQTLTFFLSFIANMELTLSSMDLERKEDSSDVNSILKKSRFSLYVKRLVLFQPSAYSACPGKKIVIVKDLSKHHWKSLHENKGSSLFS